MKPVRVRLTMAWGPGPEIDAYPTPVPGLVIHRAFGQPDDLYTITQQHSGVGLIIRLPSPEAALGAALELAGLADWTQPVDLSAVYRDGSRIARRWGSVLPSLDDKIANDTARAAGAIL